MLKWIRPSNWYGAVHIGKEAIHGMLVQLNREGMHVHARYVEQYHPEASKEDLALLLTRFAPYRSRMRLALPDHWVTQQQESLAVPLTARECHYYIETEKTRLFPHITEDCFYDFTLAKQDDEWKLAIYAVEQHKLLPFIRICQSFKLPMDFAEIESMAIARANLSAEKGGYQVCDGLMMRGPSTWKHK